ncbi:MAG: dihydropteroate synthase [Candidatus Saliniplasma sp.]
MFQTRVLSDLDEQRRRSLLEKLGCEKRGVEIMAPKAEHKLIYAKGLDPKAANIVKQEFLAAGGEVAVSWEALNISEQCSEIIMMGTHSQYRRVLKKLKEQPFDLNLLAEEVEKAIQNFDEPPYLPWSTKRTEIMGVLNVTPDSFHDGGRFDTKNQAVKRALDMIEQGADIIDIGGESTRPGSERISTEKEKDRVLPIIKEVSDQSEVPISIDTYKPAVAEAAIHAGADMVNDVFGLRTEGMPEKIADLDVPVIIMHMQGRPKTMQEEPTYDDVITDISSFFLERIGVAEEAGIDPEKIILDPGIGFGKRLNHNLEILSRLEEFNSLGFPILLGASRKSFLGDILNKPSEGRLPGSLAVASLAVEKDVRILRVHDVSETFDVIKTVNSIQNVSWT